MGPQPFTDTTQDIAIGPMLLPERPHLAALVAEVIGRWSHIEQLMGVLMSRMFHTSAMAAVEIYLAIKSQRAQKDVIDTAAKSTLPRDHYELFSAVRILAHSLERNRHYLAHHILGIVRYDPDKLLVVEPAHLTRGTVAAWIKSKDLPSFQIMAYGEKDLRGIISGMDRVGRHIRKLEKILDPGNPQASAEYQSLCDEPDIAEVLSRQRDTKSSP